MKAVAFKILLVEAYPREIQFSQAAKIVLAKDVNISNLLSSILWFKLIPHDPLEILRRNYSWVAYYIRQMFLISLSPSYIPAVL